MRLLQLIATNYFVTIKNSFYLSYKEDHTNIKIRLLLTRLHKIFSFIYVVAKVMLCTQICY